MSGTTTPVNVQDLREAAEAQLDLDYVEAEGPDVVRFDSGGRSAWAYASGSYDGDARLIKQLKKVASKM